MYYYVTMLVGSKKNGGNILKYGSGAKSNADVQSSDKTESDTPLVLMKHLL